MNVIEWHKMDYLIFSAMRMRKCHLFCTSSHHNVPYEQQELSKWSEPWNKFLARACAQLLICPTLLQTWAYHMEKLSRRLFYIYGNWYFLWVELSGWMGSVSYGLGADLSLPPSLPVGDDRYLNLSSQKRPTGRNLGGNRLVRRSGTTSRGTVVLMFCLRMRNFPLSLVLTIFVGMKWIA